jgi:hypothetical protein
MRTFIAIMIVLLPSMAFAATTCRTVEYPDHTEAICMDDTAPSPAPSRIDGQNQSPAAALSPEALAAAQEPDASASPEDRPDVSPETIVWNSLSRAHGDSVLKSSHGRW